MNARHALAACAAMAASLIACAPAAPGVARAPSSPPIVFVLGSLHGAMLANPRFGLRDFLAAFDVFSPDLVLTEVRPDHAGPAEGAIDGGIEQSLVYAAAAERGVPIVAIDWFDDAFIAEMAAENRRPPPPAAAPLEAEYDDAIHHAPFGELESPKTRELVRKIYALYEAAGQTASRTRNERICGRLRAAVASRAARRVLVVFGLDHKYFLEDCAAAAGARVLDAAALVADPRWIRYRPSAALAAAARANLLDSQQLLQRRLAGHFYGADYERRLEHKLGEFPPWIEAVSRLASP